MPISTNVALPFEYRNGVLIRCNMVMLIMYEKNAGLATAMTGRGELAEVRVWL